MPEQFGILQPGIGFALSAEALTDVLQPTLIPYQRHSASCTAVNIAQHNMTEGFERILKLRRQNMPTRVTREKA